MRNLLEFVRLAAGRKQVGRPTRSPNAGWHRPGAPVPPRVPVRLLTAGQVREQRFAVVRRGLDPIEVHAYLARVAGELAATRRELIRATEENVRIKRALRSWQSRLAPSAAPIPRRDGVRR